MPRRSLLVTAAVPAKRPGCSVRHTPSGNASARSASKSMTPDTKRRWTALRDVLGEQDFDAAWAEGAALSTEEAIAYAQRGRGERKRPPPAGGRRSPRPSATSSASSAKDSATRTSPHGCSSHRAPCKPTSLTSTPNFVSPRGCNLSKKQPATPELANWKWDHVRSGSNRKLSSRHRWGCSRYTPVPARGAQTRCSSGPTNQRLASLIA